MLSACCPQAPDFHSSPLLFRRLTHRLNSKVQEKSSACERSLHSRGFALNYCETSGYNTGHGSFSEPSCLVLQPEGHIFSTESETSRRNQHERGVKREWETGTGVGLHWTSERSRLRNVILGIRLWSFLLDPEEMSDFCLFLNADWKIWIR